MVQAGDQIPIDTEQVAQLRVQHFVRSFDDSYLTLACHAALPLILTPELVNYLRNRFMPGEVPWVAEADLLLSDLCREVAYETYAMEPDVRSFLLDELQQRFGLKRMQDVARLMVNYVRHLARTNPKAREYELQTQQWAALAYLDDQRSETVKELAESLKACLEGLSQTGDSHAAANQAEIIRLSRIVDDLKSQLRDYPDLIKYAQLTSEILTAPEGFELDEAESHARFSEPISVEGVVLPALNELKPPVAAGTETIQKPVSVTRWAFLLGNPYESDPTASGVKDLASLFKSVGYRVQQRTHIVRQGVRQDSPMFAQVGPDDLCFFYYAGPTVTRQFTAPMGGKPFLPDLPPISFTLENLFEILVRTVARKIVVFLDPTDSGPERPIEILSLPPELTRQEKTIAVIAPDARGETKPGDFSSRLVTVFKRLIDMQLDQPLKLRDLIQSLYSVAYGYEEPDIRFEMYGNAQNIVLFDGEPDTRVSRPPLRNPFLTPTTNFNHGFGREALISEIVNIIRRDEDVWLIGKAGMGKTLILKSLIEVGTSQLNLPPGAVMYFNLNSIRDESEILSIIHHNFPRPPPEEGGHTFTRVSNYKADRVVICVDNVDRANSVGLNQILVALDRAGLGNVKVSVVCASRELESPPMKGRYSLVNVPPINLHDARYYISKELAESGIEFSEAEIEAIFNESKGSPNRLRKLAATVFEKYASSMERDLRDSPTAGPAIPFTDQPKPSVRDSVVRKRPEQESERTTLSVGQTGQYRSLKEAVAKAKPFDTLQLLPGVYTESVIINKPMTISGYGSVQIDSRGKTCIEIRADHCELHDLNISGTGRGHQYGIRVVKGNATIADCTIKGFGYDGIEVRPGASAEILRSTFRENLCGVCFEGSGKVEDSLVQYNEEAGIFVGAKGYAHVLRNHIDDNGCGILIEGGRARIEQNFLADNQNGPIIQTKGIKGAVEVIDNVTSPAEPPARTKAKAARGTSSVAVSSPIRTSKGASKSRPPSKSRARKNALKTSSKSGSKSSRKVRVGASKSAVKRSRRLGSKTGRKAAGKTGPKKK